MIKTRLAICSICQSKATASWNTWGKSGWLMNSHDFIDRLGGNFGPCKGAGSTPEWIEGSALVKRSHS